MCGCTVEDANVILPWGSLRGSGPRSGHPTPKRQVRSSTSATPPEWSSAPHLNLPPEGVHPGVPLVWDLLEGLVGLSGHDLEACLWDCLGDRSPDARRQDVVELPGQDQRRRGDLRKAVRRVVPEAHVDLCLKCLDGLLVGERQRLRDDLV